MRKSILKLFGIGVLAVALQSCSTQKVVVNREVTSKVDGKMLLGTQTKDQLLKEPYSAWYHDQYEKYIPNETLVKELKKNKLNSYSMTVFLGTWCEDSHIYIPQLMKILETLKYPEGKLTLVAVNRKYESPAGEEGLFNIQKVPTIILKRNGIEIGRMKEYPQSGILEQDLVDIIKKDDKSIKNIFN